MSPIVSHYHSLFVLFKPSLSTLLCQIVMYFSSYLPALFCLISRFDPFCGPRLLFLESVFCIDLTRSFRTLFWLSTSTHGLPLCFVALIGLLVLTHCLWPCLWSGLPLLWLFAGRITLCPDIHIVFGYSALPWSAPVRPVSVSFWLNKMKTFHQDEFFSSGCLRLVPHLPVLTDEVVVIIP